MLIVESILDAVVENLNDELDSKVVKIIIAVVFVLFYLFIVAGILSLGFSFFSKNFFLGSIFILIALVIFVFFLSRFIIIYSKKLNKLSSKIAKFFKINKK